MPARHVEHVEMSGLILLPHLLPHVLAAVIGRGATYEIQDIRVGKWPGEPSHARLEIRAESAAALDRVLADIHPHGAGPVAAADCAALPADVAGAFPDGFYCSTHSRTQVRLGGEWVEVEDQERNCGIVLDPEGGAARCVPMAGVAVGDRVVVGRAGVRVLPSEGSGEKPPAVSVREIAHAMRRTKAAGEKVLAVLGPAVVRGGGEWIAKMIRDGDIHVLFADNALATRDIAQALSGTGEGREHRLRAINTVRRLGGIRAAIEAGTVTSGILYECATRGVPVVLAGGIGDDGPLPEVVTDTLAARDAMRALVPGIGFCLMVAATHGVAAGNLLPAWVRAACVDTRSDAGSFLRSLAAELDREGAA